MVQQNTKFRNDASWSERRPEILMGNFESKLASVLIDLEMSNPMEASSEEEWYISLGLGIVRGFISIIGWDRAN